MVLKPHNDCVLCRKVTDDKTTKNINGFSCQVDALPTYQIIDIGEKIDKTLFNINDIIVCNSTGTKLVTDTDEVFYLFHAENIVGKEKS